MSRPYMSGPLGGGWILMVLGPPPGIGLHVFPQRLQLSLVANDSVVEAALPDRTTGLPADSRFVSAHKAAQVAGSRRAIRVEVHVDNAVHVVGHEHEDVRFSVGDKRGDSPPFGFGDRIEVRAVQYAFIVDGSEQGLA